MGGLVHKADRRRYLLLKYSDHHHEVERAFKLFNLDKYGQLMWLDKWSQIDQDENNMVEYEELVEYFSLPDNIWTKRLYDLINADMNGALDFLEFFIFAVQYCLLNKQALIEFSFRLLSRRGATFEAEHSVLDLHDISKFLEQRYDDITHKQLKKRAQGLFEELDSDLSGGITLDEFTEVVHLEDTLIFVSLGWFYLEKLRAGLFGTDYWRHVSPPCSEQDMKLFEQVAELSHLAVESTAIEFFSDDFPVLYKKIKAKRKFKKDKEKNLRCVPLVTVHAYARLITWFKVIAFQDLTFHKQVAFKQWFLSTHQEDDAWRVIPSHDISMDGSLMSGSITPADDSLSEIEMDANGLEPLIHFSTSITDDEEINVNSVEEYCFKKPKTIYELLNEPPESRWVPNKILYEDYEKMYVDKLHHNSKYNNAPFVSPVMVNIRSCHDKNKSNNNAEEVDHFNNQHSIEEVLLS